MGKSFEAAGRVDAGAEVVWRELVDVGAWRDWRSGVDRVEGLVSVGAVLTVYHTAARGRGASLRVTELRPAAAMRWRGGMPFGLYTVERCFRLDPQSDGSTEVTVTETHTGPLAGLLLARVVADPTTSLRTFVTGLAARVLARSRTGT